MSLAVCDRRSCSGSWRSVSGSGESPRYHVYPSGASSHLVSSSRSVSVYSSMCARRVQKEMEQKDRLVQQLKHKLEETQVCFKSEKSSENQILKKKK